MKYRILCVVFFISILCFSFSVQAETISSHTVLKRTFEQTPEAQALVMTHKIAKEDLLSAKAQYDTGLFSQYGYEKNLSERSIPIMGTDTATSVYNIGLTQLTPVGTVLSAGFYNTKSETDSAFASANTFYDSRFSFNLTQPLLNNFLGFQNRNLISMTRQRITISENTTNAQWQGLAYRNLQYYWAWYLYSKIQSISTSALSATQKLYRTNRQKMEIGLIEEADIYAFAANVDMAQAALLDVKAKKDSVESELRVALDLADKQLIPVQESTKLDLLPDVGQMITDAKKNNPEYLALEKTLQVQNLVVAMKKNSRLPQLDLTASLTLNGIDPDYATAFSDIGDYNPIWSGGVNLKYPLQNRQARADYNKEKFRRAKALFDLKNAENKILLYIEKGFEKYRTAQSRMQVMATAVKHQKLKWEGEIKKYDQGRSDPDLVIRYQNDYLDAQKMYVQSQVDYFLARLDLDYARGVLKP